MNDGKEEKMPKLKEALTNVMSSENKNGRKNFVNAG